MLFFGMIIEYVGVIKFKTSIVMTTQILNFKKTNHFLYSQWDRSIHDEILYKVLPYVACTTCKKDVVIVCPSFLKRKGIKSKNRESLIIITSNNTLTTCYWCDHPDYLYSKEPFAHFQNLR